MLDEIAAGFEELAGDPKARSATEGGVVLALTAPAAEKLDRDAATRLPRLLATSRTVSASG